MEHLLSVSVVLPTYNREMMLRETLDSLARQTYPADYFEVIVVDDGSTDATGEIRHEAFPFQLRYFRQENQGDAAARNTAALNSQAEILVSLDDDIVVEPDYLASLIEEYDGSRARIVVGLFLPWLKDNNPLLDNSRFDNIPKHSEFAVNLPFVEFNTHSMSVPREAYISLGLMQGLDFPGSSMWSDVDFAYRAYLEGFTFVRTTKAICWHRDYVHRSFENEKRRAREASFRAVALFQKYPELIRYLPMFDDKRVIEWGNDSPAVIVRKSARKVMSNNLVLRGLDHSVALIESRASNSLLKSTLKRWVLGGYIYQGYRQGLRELA
jgi:glycosyltransferase involved in cell wall biosynthesis